MTLVYRQEYRKVTGAEDCPEVKLPQEWLIEAVESAEMREGFPRSEASFRLLAHCTEKTNVPAATALWPKVFEKVGLKLAAQASDCCGMSGTYGHEALNLETSKVIFKQSWGSIVDGPGHGELLATGYSCRSQVSRLREKRIRYPLEALLDVVRQ